MTREIRHTPIPSVEHTSTGESEEVELVCQRCDLTLHAEGYMLLGLAARIDEWHRQRHQGGTP